MSQGFLVICVPSKSKKPRRDKQGTKKVRLLNSKYSASNYVKKYIDPTDEEPTLTVQVFNTNGYPERIVKGKEALAEFSGAL